MRRIGFSQEFNYLKLFAVFLLTTVTLSALQSPAVIQQLETMKTKKISNASAPDVRKTAKLEIWVGKDGGPRYKFQPSSGHATETGDVASLLGTIKHANPIELIVRADKRVTVGDMEAIILPAREHGIQIYRSNDKQ